MKISSDSYFARILNLTPFSHLEYVLPILGRSEVKETIFCKYLSSDSQGMLCLPLVSII